MLKTETNEITGSYVTNHGLFSPLQEGKKKKGKQPPPPSTISYLSLGTKKKVKALLIGLIADT